MHINLLFYYFLQIGCLLLFLVMATQRNKFVNINIVG